MTLGKRIKQLRIQQAISQEKLAEKLNVSRSAIAKWETDGGIPELENLLQLAKVFDVSLDELTGNMKNQEREKMPAEESYSAHDFGKQHYDIDLTGWNDGVYDAVIIGEDKDFLFYRKTVRNKSICGVIGKRYITSLLPKENIESAQVPAIDISREYFCRKPVAVECNKKDGLIRGFLDFRDDDYRNVVIDDFEESVLRLQFGRKINISAITKIEELIN